MTNIMILILLCWILYWLGGLYFTIKKGFNEIIKGLSSIDERLERIEKKWTAPENNQTL